MPRVSKSTLWHRDEPNNLNVVKLGSKTRYRKSDINNILQGGNPHLKCKKS